VKRAEVRGAASLALWLAAAGPAGGPPWVSELIGEPARVVVSEGTTLLDIAHERRLGYSGVERLNPDVDPWLPEPGTTLELPSWSILPDAPARGLVINLPELRMYDFTATEAPRVHAIAIGDVDWPTPTGSFSLGARRAEPVWYVPDSIRAERPELPAAVPPGPANPLGSHWITIGASSYGLHGTNNPWSIGRLATHGCVRLYEEVMRELFESLPAAAPLRIVYQTLKLGARDGRLYLEAHPDWYGLEPRAYEELLGRLMVLRVRGFVEGEIDAARVERIARDARGIPIEIGRLTS
jgi:L,D-transpeptidase ErfK/SrfK